MNCPEHNIGLISKATRYGRRYYCPVDGCTVVWWGGRNTTPADEATRNARQAAHLIFDALWHGNDNKERQRLYRKLASYLDRNVAETHIGLFDVATCEKVLEFAKEYKIPVDAITEGGRRVGN